MSHKVGKKLPKLDRGDFVVATIDGDRYEGTVTDTERWKCELNQGFMESGSITVNLKLNSDTVSSYDIPTGNIVIDATESAPLQWDIPTASIYDQNMDERTTQLGAVSDLEVHSTSID